MYPFWLYDLLQATDKGWHLSERDQKLYDFESGVLKMVSTLQGHG